MLTEDHINNISANRLGFEAILIHNNGIKESMVSLRNFCKKYNLSRHEISKVVKGSKIEHKGWKLLCMIR